MTDSLPVSCPYCGEAVDLDIDEGGGDKQAYVQDCPVCCRPWRVEIACGPDGDWIATLRTEDE